MAKFICGTNSVFNSYHYPMNNVDSVWELGFRVEKIGKILGTGVLGEVLGK